MKKGIHPKYYKKAQVKCACGNVIELGSTLENVNTEICSACHPFYTGKKKLVDSTGRVDRFKKMKEQQDKLLKAQLAAKEAKKKTIKKEKATAEEK